METQFLIAGPVLLVLGIPHGAIDNVLYRSERKMSDVRFVTIYLLGVGGIFFFWWFVPKLTYLSFLLISAYHFGQSQFSHYFKQLKMLNRFLFWFWGIAILAALILFNDRELSSLAANSKEFGRIHISNISLVWIVFGLSSACTLFLLTYFTLRKQLRREHLFMELLTLVLLLVTFYTLPFLIGFTLYFVVLHALKVMNEEYCFLKSIGYVKELRSFIKLLSPFSIVSMVGIIVVFILTQLKWIDLPFSYLLLIIISAITIPHAVVMDHFYALLFRKKFYAKNRIAY